MRTIGRQLASGMVAVLLLTVVLVGQGSVWLFDRALRSYLTDVLQSETDSLLAALTAGPSGLYLDSKRIDPDYQRPFSGRYFVIDASERWRSRSLWDQALPLDAEGLHNTLVAGPNQQRLLVWSGRYEKLGEQVRISVAIDYLPLLQSFERARWWIWGLGGLAILIAIGVQQWLLTRALRPLRRARRELSEWHAGQRLLLNEQVPDELRSLVEEINHLGRQVEQIIKRSRSGLGDLGHALKTPLAVMESLIQQSSGELPAERYASLETQLQSMRAQLERALQRSRLAPESQAGQRFQPAEDLHWLLDSLRSLHGDRVTVLVEGEQVQEWPFEREDMLELLGNLLDNACKWATSRVVLSWHRHAGVVSLRVEDDGPGIAPERRQQALQRGTRLDERVDGHGLGLAIVSDLVEVYQGDMALDESSMGGLAVVVELPVRR